MRICLVPLSVTPQKPGENLQRFQEAMKQVDLYKPDLVCLPECAFTGYLYEEDMLERFAETIPGPTVAKMAQIARLHRVHLCFGMLERVSDKVYDSAVLLNRQGKVVLVQRKMSEQPPFARGTRVEYAEIDQNKVAVLICGDLFHREAVGQLPSDLSLLLVPMARAFALHSPDKERWVREERAEYLKAIRDTNTPTALVNALDVGIDEPSFGGAMIVDRKGNLLQESPHGTDEILVYDMICKTNRDNICDGRDLVSNDEDEQALVRAKRRTARKHLIKRWIRFFRRVQCGYHSQ